MRFFVTPGLLAVPVYDCQCLSVFTLFVGCLLHCLPNWIILSSGLRKLLRSNERLPNDPPCSLGRVLPPLRGPAFLPHGCVNYWETIVEMKPCVATNFWLLLTLVWELKSKKLSCYSLSALTFVLEEVTQFPSFSRNSRHLLRNVWGTTQIFLLFPVSFRRPFPATLGNRCEFNTWRVLLEQLLLLLLHWHFEDKWQTAACLSSDSILQDGRCVPSPISFMEPKGRQGLFLWPTNNPPTTSQRPINNATTNWATEPSSADWIMIPWLLVS